MEETAIQELYDWLNNKTEELNEKHTHQNQLILFSCFRDLPIGIPLAQAIHSSLGYPWKFNTGPFISNWQTEFEANISQWLCEYWELEPSMSLQFAKELTQQISSSLSGALAQWLVFDTREPGSPFYSIYDNDWLFSLDDQYFLVQLRLSD